MASGERPCGSCGTAVRALHGVMTVLQASSSCSATRTRSPKTRSSHDHLGAIVWVVRRASWSATSRRVCSSPLVSAAPVRAAAGRPWCPRARLMACSAFVLHADRTRRTCSTARRRRSSASVRDADAGVHARSLRAVAGDRGVSSACSCWRPSTAGPASVPAAFKRRRRLAVVVRAVGSVEPPLPAGPRRAPQGRDCRFLLIATDSLRADHLRCNGYARETSPHIDALAARGTNFAQVPRADREHPRVLGHAS